MTRSKENLVYVAASTLHGKGLFARVPIQTGEIIGWIEAEPANKNGPHVLWVSAKKGLKVNCCLRYINHADDPNACYYDDGSVMALRDIETGEEITHNYAGESK